jgi:hypothetical protein
MYRDHRVVDLGLRAQSPMAYGLGMGLMIMIAFCKTGKVFPGTV